MPLEFKDCHCVPGTRCRLAYRETSGLRPCLVTTHDHTYVQAVSPDYCPVVRLTLFNVSYPVLRASVAWESR